MEKSKIINQVGQNISGTSSEDRIMSDCHLWLWNSFPATRYLCWHVPNERKQSRVQGARLKAKGVVSGVPDYVINWNGKTFYIEFKTPKGKQSENQKKVQKQLEQNNIHYVIIRSVEEFKNYCINIIKIN